MSRHHDVFYRFNPCSDKPEAQREIDFLGCRIRHEFWPNSLRSGVPQRTYPPFDEEYFEWIDVLESVVQARDSYTMVDLGAGFGRWMVRAAVAMRQSAGLPCHFVAVEAEPRHFSWIPLHFRDNGIDPSGHTLYQAAVTDRPGHAQFYIGMPSEPEEIASEWYGQSLIKPHEIASDANGGAYEGFSVITHASGWKSIRVRTITLSHIMRSLFAVDLLDLDIQGEELKAISSAIDEISKKVRRIHLATHSSEVETGLRHLLPEFGWKLLTDYPCFSECATPWGQISFNDGVQSWINSRLC